jgi:predicted metal-dependent peptidase
MLLLLDKLQAARLRLATERPYMGTALYTLVPVERPGLGTLAVDKWWRLYYDPEAVATWDVIHLAGVLYHEIAHLLRAHHERFEHAEKITANVSTDIEINDDIRDEGVQLPEGALYPEAFNLPAGLLAEEYYAKLTQGQQGQQGGNSAAQGSRKRQRRTRSSAAQGGDKHQQDDSAPTGEGSADGQQGQNAAAQAGGSGQEQKASQSNSGTGKPAPTCGRCGSCAHGHQEPWELGSPESSGVPGVSEAEAEVIRRQVAHEIVRIATQSKERGSVPAHWRRWAEEKLRPKVDWRRQLRSAVRAALATVTGAADYSYRKLPRRRLPGIITPGLVQPVPEVAIVVDTSGSMGDNLLAQALAEMHGVLRATGTHGATVLAVDAAVHTAQRVFDPRQVKLVGGGGTDMRVGIDAALKLRPRPHVIIVLTDGLTTWGDTPVQGVQVIAGVIGTNDVTTPKWVKAIPIPIEELTTSHD